MKLDFDFDKMKVTEFGIGRDDGDTRTFVYVPVDAGVQYALREMAESTWTAMKGESNDPPRYDPSEKHSSIEYVCLPLKDDLCSSLRALHQATNLTPDAKALAEPTKVFCYFVRMTDDKSRRLTAIRRATQFKGVLKNRLVRLTTDALRIIKDKVFKLDNDFDLLIDSKNIHILRPSGFEFVGQLEAAVLGAVSQNIATIQQDIKFVDFDGIEVYASTHPRAARYLASIQGQKETKNIDKQALKKLCKSTGVVIDETSGKIVVDESDIMGFLEVLDRRRYQIELVKSAPERYRAASRKLL
jgi:hypothetical protein